MSKQKTFWISFLALASVLILMGFASATQIATITSVKINSVETLNSNTLSVLAGNTVPIGVTFTANANESNVRLTADFQGANGDSYGSVFVGDIETGQTYIEPLTLTVPSNIGDLQSNNLNLVITVWNGDSSVTQTVQTVTLREQRQSYNVGVMSLNTVASANAGSLLPVNVVLKNTGYNQLNDVYVTVSIPALNLQRTAFFGDMANPIGNDTSSGTVYLQLPYNAAPGTYTVQADIQSSYIDTTSTTTFLLNNQFQSNVIADTSQQTTGVGQSITYNLEIVNPTNSINVYQIIPQTIPGVTMSIDSIATVPAGSSKTVPLTVTANSAGNYNLNLSVLSGGQITGNVNLVLNAQGVSSNPVVILTIVLAVIFVVLLVVLLVLVTKKPKKQEGLNESYY